MSSLIDPKILGSTKLVKDGHEFVQVIFRCMRVDCQELFIGYYAGTSYESNVLKCYYEYSAPMKYEKIDFSEVINEVSPTFIEIYNQAIEAESQNLDQIVGMGLRKAVEFLVKDFAITQHEKKTEEIKKAYLANCIDTYINDSNVKKCAERATWLGNDETHYIRKWEDKDIKDLKLLVRLTTNWIENVILTAKYEEEMNKK